MDSLEVVPHVICFHLLNFNINLAFQFQEHFCLGPSLRRADLPVRFTEKGKKLVCGFEYLLGIYWASFGHLLGIFWASLGYLLGIFWESFGHARCPKRCPNRLCRDDYFRTWTCKVCDNVSCQKEL